MRLGHNVAYRRSVLRLLIWVLHDSKRGHLEVQVEEVG